MIEIGRESFFADGIYLGGPRVDRGTVTLEHTQLAENTFLGNHVVIPAGQHLPPDILLGVCTVADEAVIRAGTSWFGHPPFELPRREVIACDRRLTHEPSLIRYVNRVFWESLRFTLPAVPALVLLVWYQLLAIAEAKVSGLSFLLLAVPAISLGAAALFLPVGARSQVGAARSRASRCASVVVLLVQPLGFSIRGLGSLCARLAFHS